MLLIKRHSKHLKFDAIFINSYFNNILMSKVKLNMHIFVSLTETLDSRRYSYVENAFWHSKFILSKKEEIVFPPSCRVVVSFC